MNAPCNRIVHPYGTGLTPSLEAALERRGLVFEQIEAGKAIPLDCLAYLVWFYFPMRSPLEAFRIKRRLAPRGVPLVAWNRDAPHYLNRAAWRLDLFDRARLLDIYATHTLVDTRRQFAELQLYLPNAADTSRYNAGPDPVTAMEALRNTSSYEFDVSFFGAMNGARYKEMRARQEFFTELGRRLSAKRIRFLFREADDMSLADQIQLIRTSRINLNYGASCEYLAPSASGLPERCYGIPAVGGFLLCDRRLHARDDFDLGQNWAEFDGLDDCVRQIEFWLANFDAARRLAERCHEHVMAHHTYTNRAEKLHLTLLDWHAGRRGLVR